jgi:hypothetical protein
VTPALRIRPPSTVVGLLSSYIWTFRIAERLPGAMVEYLRARESEAMEVMEVGGPWESKVAGVGLLCELDMMGV